MALVGFWVVNFCYFDDDVVSCKTQARSAEQTFSCLLDLLGWTYDKEGPKASSMGQSLAVLDVLLGLSQTHLGSQTQRNEPWSLSRRFVLCLKKGD